MTELYLIRHGIAADREHFDKDEERPLTDLGDRKTRKIAKRLLELGIGFDLIFTSPLLRARQTAEILKDIGLGSQIQETSSLVPDGEIEQWIAELAGVELPQLNDRPRFALVGHQPDLGNWAEILVWGEVRERIVLKKAGTIGLTLPEVGSPVGRSWMFWLTPPKFLL